MKKLTALQLFNLSLKSFDLSDEMRRQLFDLAEQIDEEAYSRGYDNGHEVGHWEYNDAYESIR